jgi:hypothetical protein
MGQAVNPGKAQAAVPSRRVAQLSGTGTLKGLQPIVVKNWPKALMLSDFKKLTEAEALKGKITTQGGNVGYRLKPSYNPVKARLGNSMKLKDIKVALVLDRDHTWIVDSPTRKSKMSDADLLHHEQGHYDIGGLLARELGRKMQFIFGKDKPALKTAVGTAKAKVIDKGKKINKQYDDETNHGTDKKEQRSWDAIIMTSINNKKNLPDPK